MARSASSGVSANPHSSVAVVSRQAFHHQRECRRFHTMRVSHSRRPITRCAAGRRPRPYRQPDRQRAQRGQRLTTRPRGHSLGRPDRAVSTRDRRGGAVPVSTPAAVAASSATVGRARRATRCPPTPGPLRPHRASAPRVSPAVRTVAGVARCLLSVAGFVGVAIDRAGPPVVAGLPAGRAHPTASGPVSGVLAHQPLRHAGLGQHQRDQRLPSARSIPVRADHLGYRRNHRRLTVLDSRVGLSCHIPTTTCIRAEPNGATPPVPPVAPASCWSAVDHARVDRPPRRVGGVDGVESRASIEPLAPVPVFRSQPSSPGREYGAALPRSRFFRRRDR